MNGVLAQTAALAAHARVKLLDARLGGDEAYWERHSTLKYTRALTFKARRRGLFRSAEVVVASNPMEWMSTLPNREFGWNRHLGYSALPAVFTAASFTLRSRSSTYS